MDDLSDIENRLKALRGEPSDPMDQKEFEERVARLKGLNPEAFTSPPITVYTKPDLRSDHEKASDLVKQMMEESAIDDQWLEQNAAYNPDSELEKRLNKLRDGEPSCRRPLIFDSEDSDIDSDEETKRVSERLVAEAALPDVPTSPLDDSGKSSKKKQKVKDLTPEEEDFPWCVICNEDAILSCKGCDDDLYCKSCFKEFHQDAEDRRHKTVMMPTPKRENSDSDDD